MYRKACKGAAIYAIMLTWLRRNASLYPEAKNLIESAYEHMLLAHFIVD